MDLLGLANDLALQEDFIEGLFLCSAKEQRGCSGWLVMNLPTGTDEPRLKNRPAQFSKLCGPYPRKKLEFNLILRSEFQTLKKQKTSWK